MNNPMIFDIVQTIPVLFRLESKPARNLAGVSKFSMPCGAIGGVCLLWDPFNFVPRIVWGKSHQFLKPFFSICTPAHASCLVSCFFSFISSSIFLRLNRLCSFRSFFLHLMLNFFLVPSSFASLQMLPIPFCMLSVGYCFIL